MSFHTDEAVLRYEHVDVSFEGCAVLHDISIIKDSGCSNR